MRSEVLLLPALSLVIAGARKNEPALSLRPLIAVSRPTYKAVLLILKPMFLQGLKALITMA